VASLEPRTGKPSAQKRRSVSFLRSLGVRLSCCESTGKAVSKPDLADVLKRSAVLVLDLLKRLRDLLVEGSNAGCAFLVHASDCTISLDKYSSLGVGFIA
jgi:hypothetical protein